MSWYVRVLTAGAFILVLLAGCSEQEQIKTAQPGELRAANGDCRMPSYPILLVDLPRLAAGQPVRPAYCYPYRSLEEDMDSPPPTVAAHSAKPPTAVDVSLVP
ncbi:MAG TPA: hypothetical protein VNA25_28415 [Phycisphaerae bacterium]|nr:hypothetical protein [Phycisphaerae bacterium]